MPNQRKPTALHVVEGTYNTTRHKDRQNEPATKSGLIKPKFLKGRASKLWDEYAPRLWWLGDADSHHLAVYCGLVAEYERGPDQMLAARIGQMRAFAGELGIAAARSKFNAKKNGEEKDKEGQYFN